MTRWRRRLFVAGVLLAVVAQGCTYNVAFAQKSAIRQSTHVVLENTFRKLIEDMRAGYQEWMK